MEVVLILDTLHHTSNLKHSRVGHVAGHIQGASIECSTAVPFYLDTTPLDLALKYFLGLGPELLVPGTSPKGLSLFLIIYRDKGQGQSLVPVFP